MERLHTSITGRVLVLACTAVCLAACGGDDWALLSVRWSTVRSVQGRPIGMCAGVEPHRNRGRIVMMKVCNAARGLLFVVVSVGANAAEPWTVEVLP